MKRLSHSFAFLLMSQCIMINSPSLAMAQACVIKWWGASTGFVLTNETSRTEQARHEAFQAVFGEPGCSGTQCFIYGCFPLFQYPSPPEGCDGLGGFECYSPFCTACYTDILCDTGSWAYSRITCSPENMESGGGNWDVLCGIDTDNDGWPDLADNCIDNYNPLQIDCDIDGMGDICDPDEVDLDGDGIDDACDNCPNTTNPSQEDTDSSGIGNACNDLIDADSDEWEDSLDNCPSISNTLQEDSRPPQGNGIGDTCDCEGDFSCDDDVDGSDASTFKADFGRSVMVHPCIAGDTCNGDFSCDGDVDGTDASLFKSDFGRSSIQNPCPTCAAGAEWCSYQ